MASNLGLYRDQGIVLKGIKLGEADRIVTIYSQSHGRIRAVAKGVRKARSRFGARLDAFTHVDLQLYAGRGDLDIVTQADIIARFPRLREDYPAFVSAGAMADAVERTTPDREKNVRLFVLLRSGLQALEDGAEDPPTLAYAFLAKVASIWGLHPTLTACVTCGALERVAFSFADGGVVCSGCVQRSDPVVSPATLEAWSVFLTEGWDDLRSRRLHPDTQREVATILLGFVQWHAESRFRAFGLLTAT